MILDTDQEPNIDEATMRTMQGNMAIKCLYSIVRYSNDIWERRDAFERMRKLQVTLDSLLDDIKRKNRVGR